MLYTLKRHPVPIIAHLRDCLVLTYAMRADVLERVLPPGLQLDRLGDVGFLAIAVVRADQLRPAFLPASFGRSFILSGYRIFTKFRTPHGRTMRGLYILRSDANDRRMVGLGNLLTHYHYHLCGASIDKNARGINIEIKSGDGSGDLSVRAGLRCDGFLPVHSPFRNAREARRFAGPLPYTFDYEAETNSIVVIKGVRSTWNPRLVAAEVSRCSFLEHEAFCNAQPALASAFYVNDVPYRWERGRAFSLKEVRS